VIGTVVVFHSVSAARALSLRLAQRDCRTGLPNRMLPNDRMTQAISLSRRRGNQLALLSHVERAEDAAVSARARC
jgi:GGDEF domain-containing protein